MSECPNICGEELKPLTNACALDAQLQKARREIAEFYKGETLTPEIVIKRAGINMRTNLQDMYDMAIKNAKPINEPTIEQICSFIPPCP